MNIPHTWIVRLSLACRSGNIIMANLIQAINWLIFTEAVGPSDTIIGFVISSASLGVARSKAKATGLEISFVYHDISHLPNTIDPAIQDGQLNIISYVAVLMLLPDYETGQSSGNLAENCFLMPPPTTDDVSVWVKWLKTLKKANKVIEDVEARCYWIFMSKSYRNTEIDVEDARKIFNEMLDSGVRWNSFIIGSRVFDER